MKKSTIPLLLLPALCLLEGWLDYAQRPARHTTGYVFELLVFILILCWYHYDTMQRGYRRSKGQLVAMLALPAFALPWYLFHSRGARQGGKAFGLALLMMLAALSCYGIGARLA
jgi:hypothetical protein